ncbi:ABC transporter ATP-binding protein [Pseudomonas sp. dw_358]|uniref:ABC transporter ATP-binding protein n=1 Tax=Pseudomonas sp. dw_358 TaxID=2720083 RepID=UPI001BD3A0DB|nr:ABC transporter ATP-binding protein [Pseudomonas sp. dw_358]
MSPSLLISGIEVAYGRKRILHGVSLPALPPGSVTALIGPNGAGKSTLLRAVAGLERFAGQVQVGDADLAHMSIAERARHVTYMPQTLPPNLDLSVLECLLAALRARGDGGTSAAMLEQARNVLTRLGIAALADAYLSRLSGGQRQLVSLAQLVLRRPQVMLLDEPTSALDLNYQLKVMECVRQQVREHQAVAVVVLHDINLAARYADHLAVLQNGRLYGFGSPAQVLDAQLFAEVYKVSARLDRDELGGVRVRVDHALG